jgi:orotidine-5'-phosphate decarboxylase
LWPQAIERVAGREDPPAPSAVLAGRAVAAHCSLAIEAAAEHCVAVKLQVACFERLGAPGWDALAVVVERAREQGLLVIADAKRGDIDVSAAAYAQAYLGETATAYGSVSGLGADALTVNPLLGVDSLRPLAALARERSCGLFIVVRTSNPGARDLQELALAQGGSVSERLADMVGKLGGDGIGVEGLSDVGAVVGATAPERFAALRARIPEAIFLVPGVGAQGGRIEDLGAAFAPGPAGALISVSRGIVQAYERLGGDPRAAAAQEAQRLRDRVWELASDR